MRDILFKAQRLDNKEWVEGYYAVKGTDLEKHYIVVSTFNANLTGYPFYFTDIEINPETLCQYTGFHMNGNKIWENDIVQDKKHEEYVGIVRYGKYARCDCDQHKTFVGFYVDWKWESDLLRKDLGFWEDKVKIIRNIFDNPEIVAPAIIEQLQSELEQAKEEIQE